MLVPTSNKLKTGVGAVLHSNEFTRNFWRPAGASNLIPAGIMEIRDYALTRLDPQMRMEVFLSNGRWREREVPIGVAAKSREDVVIYYGDEYWQLMREYVDNGGTELEVFLAPDYACMPDIKKECDKSLLYEYYHLKVSPSEPNEQDLVTTRGETMTKLLFKSPATVLEHYRVYDLSSINETVVQAQALHGAEFSGGSSCGCGKMNCKHDAVWLAGASQTAKYTADWFLNVSAPTVGIPASSGGGRRFVVDGNVILIPYNNATAELYGSRGTTGGIRVSLDCGATFAQATSLGGVAIAEAFVGVVKYGSQYVAYGYNVIAVSADGLAWDVIFDEVSAGHNFNLADAVVDTFADVVRLVGENATSPSPAPLHLEWNGVTVAVGALPGTITSDNLLAVHAFGNGDYAFGAAGTGEFFQWMNNKRDFMRVIIAASENVYSIGGLPGQPYVAVGDSVWRWGANTFDADKNRFAIRKVVTTVGADEVVGLRFQISAEGAIIRGFAVTSGGSVLQLDNCLPDACDADAVPLLVVAGSQDCIGC
jgi:hypothetical protein